MKLADNPIYRYGVKTYWRGWRLYLLPSLTVVFLMAAYMLLVPYAPVIASAFDTFASSIPPAPSAPSLPQVTAEWAWMIYAWVLSILMAGGAALLLPALVSPILAREYEHQTFESMRITPMTDSEIAWGKLAAALTPFFLCFLVSLPTSVAVAVLSRPATYMLVQAYVVYGISTVLNAIVALLLAALLRKTVPAVLLTYVAVLFVIPMVVSIISFVPVVLIFWRSFTTMFQQMMSAGANPSNPFGLGNPLMAPRWTLVLQGVQWVLEAALGVGAWLLLKAALRRRA